MKYFSRHSGNAAIITINRPKQLNALNKHTIEEINHALSSLLENKGVRGIIIPVLEIKHLLLVLTSKNLRTLVKKKERISSFRTRKAI